MPENTVQAFAQTADGFLWVGTTGGLARFDGNGFDSFDHTNTPAFTESSVLSLMVSRTGDLWVGTDGGGVVRLRSGTFSRIGDRTPLEHAFVRVILEDRLGFIWIGTDNGLFRSTSKDQTTFEQISSIPPSRVEALQEDQQGRIWVGGDRLFTLTADKVEEQRLVSVTKDSVHAVHVAMDGTVWVGTLQGLWRRHPWESSFHRISAISATVHSIAEVGGSSIWVGTSRDGVYIVHGDEALRLKTPASILSNSVFVVFQDRSCNVWIGTPAGMLRVTPSSIDLVSLPEMSASEYATVYLDRYGTVWVASRNLYKVRGNRGVRVVFPQLKGAAVTNVLMTEDSTLWFGTDRKGVFHIKPTGGDHYTTDQGLVSNNVRVLIQARDGSIWIGTDRGLSQLRGNTFLNYKIQDGLCHSEIHAIVEDAAGDIWVGTSLGLSHLHKGHFMQDVATRTLSSEKVWSITSLKEGTMLFGTRHGGLYEYRDGRLNHFTVAQGLSSDSIYKMLTDHRDHLWLSGPDGVSRISIHNLDAQAQGTMQELSSRSYYISDGANTVQFYGGMQPAGAIGPGGDVWLPSNSGLVHIALDDQLSVPVLQLRIKSIKVDGGKIAVDGPIHLSADSAALEVVYAPVFLGDQGSMHYRYKLEGVDKSWTNALSRTVAYYTNIPPGRHTFVVQGYQADRPDVLSQATLIVEKKRYFYRTWWFSTLLGLVAVVALWTIHLFRVRNVNARFDAILEERGRLAREIHDTVLQGCASVSSLLEASASAESEPSLRKRLVEYARSQISTTMNEARGAVWNLRQTNERSTSIRLSIEELCQRSSREFGIPVTSTFAGTSELLDSVTAHEIVMVIREALYNSLVHSKAGIIAIRTIASRGTLKVFVCDNGKGFDPRMAEEEGHYGLVGMKERIRSLSGSITIESRSGGGTEVVLVVSTASKRTIQQVHS